MHQSNQSTSEEPEIEWFSKILLSIGEALIVTDKTGTITSMNKVAEELTGWSLPESAGKAIENIFDAINEHTHLPIVNPINKALKENKPSLLSNHTILIKKDKTQRYIVDSAYPVHSSNSQIIGGVLIFRDVTEQTIAVKKLSESERSLKETIEKADRLQNKNRDLRLFAHAVTHDLRAPIANVLGLVSLFSSDPKHVKTNAIILEKVTGEVTKLDMMVEEMSTVISISDEEKKKEYISFDKELNRVKQVLENEIDQSKAVITSDFQEVEDILTMKSYLYSIMYNLISNAIKFRSLNAPLTIYLQTFLQDEFICLSVKDNGMGIDLKKNGDKLFGLYNRFHGDKIEGKGIGLNLVKQYAESLGGKVEVKSRVNHGSTFKIYIPLNYNHDAEI